MRTYTYIGLLFNLIFC